MTLAEIENIHDLFAKAGSRIPVCPHEWRELQMSLISPNAAKRLAKFNDRIDEMVKEKRQADVAALVKALRPVIREEIKAAMATRIGKATVKDGKVRPVVKQSASQRAAGSKKVARVVKGLKANRAAVKAKGRT